MSSLTVIRLYTAYFARSAEWESVIGNSAFRQFKKLYWFYYSADDSTPFFRHITADITQADKPKPAIPHQIPTVTLHPSAVTSSPIDFVPAAEDMYAEQSSAPVNVDILPVDL